MSELKATVLANFSSDVREVVEKEMTVFSHDTDVCTHYGNDTSIFELPTLLNSTESARFFNDLLNVQFANDDAAGVQEDDFFTLFKDKIKYKTVDIEGASPE